MPLMAVMSASFECELSDDPPWSDSHIVTVSSEVNVTVVVETSDARVVGMAEGDDRAPEVPAAEVGAVVGAARRALPPTIGADRETTTIRRPNSVRTTLTMRAGRHRTLSRSLSASPVVITLQFWHPAQAESCACEVPEHFLAQLSANDAGSWQEAIRSQFDN